MKKLFAVMVIGCLLTLSLAGSAQAQLPGTEIRASIPFDFVVRGKTLPAGDYTISRINDEPANLLVRNVHDKREHVVFETEPVEGRRIPNKDVLVFNVYGNSYFLSKVMTAGEQLGRELSPSREEKTLRREWAKNDAEPATVMVAWN